MLIQHFLHHWMRRHSHTLTHTHILYEFLRCIDRPKLKDGERKRKKAKQTNKNRIRHIKINCIIYFSVSFCRRFYFIVVKIHHTHTMPWMSASSAWKFVLTRTRLHTRKKLPQKMKHAKRRRRSSSLRNSNHSLLYILLFMSIFINCCFVYTNTTLPLNAFRFSTTTTSNWIECGFVDRSDDLSFHRILNGFDGFRYLMESKNNQIPSALERLREISISRGKELGAKKKSSAIRHRDCVK